MSDRDADLVHWLASLTPEARRGYFAVFETLLSEILESAADQPEELRRIAADLKDVVARRRLLDRRHDEPATAH